jgi:hypothetical protein
MVLVLHKLLWHDVDLQVLAFCDTTGPMILSAQWAMQQEHKLHNSMTLHATSRAAVNASQESKGLFLLSC